MTADPLVLVAELDRATDRLTATASKLDDVSAPTLCAGWTRGHVLTHLSRNADAFVNLMTWARTGVVTPMYASPEAREHAISSGADRSAGELLEDLTSSAATLRAAMLDLPAEAWAAQIRYPKDRPARAAQTVWGRLCEVEIHHVDLAAGYTPVDWPEAFTARLLHELDVPAGVTGPPSSVAAWMIGRGDGADLSGVTQPPPPWK